MVVVVGVLPMGLGVFLAIQKLDRADKWASVVGVFVGLLGVGFTVIGGVGARRQVGGQSVVDSTIGGGVAQVRGVRGSVRVGPETTPAVPPAAASSSPSPSPSLPTPSWTAVEVGSR
ncbi:hypothetical protein [Micromonospora sp. ATCC 39149]|uniref:hypothetical protein n=1 Tax=Micromonospora sp. (strain ATCC 39149 / NRRL 15099 / SCC 1413) TaxID=219305 RepID=UPI001E58480F|nr:hypothetical protein [Micromonospora sp. ATCC 39149]